MMLRSQTLALIVLFVGLVAVFVLVGSGNLNTDVFTSQPTATGTATPEPTPVPVEELWTEQQPGQLLYARDPESQALILFETMPLATAAQQLAVAAPAEDAAFPLLDMLSEVRSSLEEQAAAQNIVLRDDGLIGPYMQEVNGVGVASFRAVVDPQTVAGGGEFAGLDREWALVQRPDGAVALVLYGIQGESEPQIYTDYRAWLAENIDELTASAEATPAPDATADGDATPAAEGEGTDGEAETAEDEPVETPEIEATPIPTEGAAPEAATPAPEAAAPEEAEAIAEAVETPAPADEAGEEAEAAASETTGAEGAETTAVEQGPWTVIGPGQLSYVDIPNAFLFYNVVTLEEFVQQSGAEPPADDDPEPLLTLLGHMQNEIEAQLTERGITFGPESFEGPETQEYGGVPVAFMWLVIEGQTTAEGQATDGQELAIALVDRGDGTLTIVEFIYMGAPNPALSQAVRDWLDANVARLADPSQPLPELDALQTEPPTPTGATPAAEATVESEGAIGESAGD